ncbi:MAG: sel1 repeat family protein [Planctomycetota bacterium]|nr:sel1 repeat family protein [Planctomycetota bacterium]
MTWKQISILALLASIGGLGCGTPKSINDPGPAPVPNPAPVEPEPAPPKNYKEMSEEDLIRDGDGGALNEVGRRYYFGRGVEKDLGKAAQYFRDSAIKGNADSMYNLGVMYQHGQHVAVDEQESFRWYLKAAQAGHPEAPKFVGLMYKLGVGTEKNHAEALVWLQKSAEKGNTKAYTSIGDIYFEGTAGAVDYVKAREWYLKAAELNDEVAIGRLYLIYSSGLGLPRDPERAKAYGSRLDPTLVAAQINSGFMAKWCEGNPAKMYEFGIFLDGEGQRQGARTAIQQAADAGYEPAKEWLKSH